MKGNILKDNLPLCSISTAVLPAKPAPWPAKAHGHFPRGRNSCGGIMWKQNPMAAIRNIGM